MSSRPEFVLELERVAREAGALAQAERERMTSELKGDGSIVTNADREVEEYLRQELARLTPHASFWGEELGRDEPAEAGMWVIDPVDGTSNFSFGSPLWGVTYALMQGATPRYGIVFLPDLNEMYSAEWDVGAWKDGRRIAPIRPGGVKDHELVSYDDGLLTRFPDAKLPGKMRYSGAFVVDAVFTATARLRGMIGRREKLYDIAASVAINREAGAEIRYADGSEFRLAELLHGQKITRPWLMFPPGSGFHLG